LGGDGKVSAYGVSIGRRIGNVMVHEDGHPRLPLHPIRGGKRIEHG
jgi:hypothetical protein